MLDDLTAIREYINYLDKTHGLSVSLHTRFDRRLIFADKLSVFSIHANPYCACVKSHDGMHRNCVNCQQKALKLSSKGSFCGHCYAGVFEYVYPVTKDGETVAMVCVSGYRTEMGESKLKHFAKKYSLDVTELLKQYRLLKPSLPQKNHIDVVITPLCKMLCLAYQNNLNDITDGADLYDKVVSYIVHHHADPITLKDICEHFNYSRSHISHLFKRKNGMGVKDYINHLRIKDACYLLKHSDRTVGETALSVGFNDSNYFTFVFKNIMGVTPAKYREKEKKIES